MTTMACHITSLVVVYSIHYLDTDQRKHQSFTSLAFVWKMFPFDDLIIYEQERTGII